MNDDAQLIVLAETAPEWNLPEGDDSPPAARLLAWKPFPVDQLPEPIASWVAESAAAIPCDPSMVALPVLTMLTASIGATRRICLKPGWTEPAVLWAAVIGKSGTAKSPAIRAALAPIKRIEGAAMKRHKDAMAEYMRDVAEFEKTPKKGRQGDPPRRPVCERVMVSDITTEALASLLLDNPRGLHYFRDELAGWMAAMDQYRSGKGGDATKWLEIHGAESLRIDRKTGDDKYIYVARAAVSLTGGIQPEILRRSFGQTERDSGMLARFLLTWPPDSPKVWSTQAVSIELCDEVQAVVEKLRGLDFEPGDDGNERPVDLHLDPAARPVWIEFVNRHGQEMSRIEDDDLRAAFAKLEGAAARLALVNHLAEWATSGRATAGPVRLDAIRRGIALSDWFRDETARIYGALNGNDESAKARHVLEAVQKCGGRATVRELMRMKRPDYQGEGAAERAEADLRSLVKAGLGEWIEREPGPQGGRPTFELVLDDSGGTPGQYPSKP